MAEVSKKTWIALIARLLLVAVFIFAALPKIQDPVAFAASIEGFRLVSYDFAVWIALILPWLELVTGFGVLLPQIRRVSAVILALMLLVFIGLHASAWIRGLDITCGCFGVHESHTAPNYLLLILRNVGLLIACVCVLVQDWAQFKSTEPVR
jgi:uncharacterized membrane protein YphA (DoxX/SURF4 family)